MTLFDSLILQYTYCWSKSMRWVWLLTFLCQIRDFNSQNFLLGLFISFPLIKSYFYFFKTPFKPKFDQVNFAIKVNPALCGSTR